jgi:UDP-glucose 4-epimerase
MELLLLQAALLLKMFLRDVWPRATLRACFATSQSSTNSYATHPAFNLGNGHGYSVREVIASVERVTGTLRTREAPRKTTGRSGATDQEFDARSKRVAMATAHHRAG